MKGCTKKIVLEKDGRDNQAWWKLMTEGERESNVDGVLCLCPRARPSIVGARSTRRSHDQWPRWGTPSGKGAGPQGAAGTRHRALDDAMSKRSLSVGERCLRCKLPEEGTIKERALFFPKKAIAAMSDQHFFPLSWSLSSFL
jgi:hypothetical protein